MGKDDTRISDAPGPWADNSDYTAPRVFGSEKKSVISAWGAVLMAAGVFWWFFFKNKVPLFPDGSPNPLLYFFGPIALFLLFRAIWETARLKRFGDPVLELNNGKGTIGGTVEGKLNIGSSITGTPEFTLSLACLSHVERPGDKNTHVTVLWSDEKKTTSLLGGILPISFTVPADQPQTSYEDPYKRISWRLTIKAPLRGMAFSEKYEIPVYHASK